MTLKELYHLVLPQTKLNQSLRILITVNTGMVFVIGMFAPFYAVFVQKLGGNIAYAGLSWAILLIVTGTLILLFTNLEVKVKEQELLLALGYILRGLVFVSYAFMGSLTQLLFTQVLWGVAAAIGTPAFDAVYQSHTSPSEAISQWGGWEGISSIATGIAALFGGVLIQSFGYNSIFIAMATISFLLGLYVWRLPREML
jgi:predicted MFS family arabinose efflux permease